MGRIELYHQSVPVKVRNMRAQLIYNLIKRLPQAVFPHRECVTFFMKSHHIYFSQTAKKKGFSLKGKYSRLLESKAWVLFGGFIC